MQIHNLKPKIKRKAKKRIGRGGKRGTYSGKGMKGQKSRAGRKMRPELRDIIKKIPKKRGYRFKSLKAKAAILNLDVLEAKFKTGAEINPQALLEAGLIRREKGKIPEVKLLGSGSLTKKLLVSKCQLSKSAEEKIKKAGGKIKE